MTEQKEKKSSGAGKFFLGAALGAIAGAVASKFVSAKNDECECDENCDCACKGEHADDGEYSSKKRERKDKKINGSKEDK